MSAPRSSAARRVERPIRPNPLMPTRVLMSDLLGLHLDCSTGALLDTDAAALAEVVVELVRVRRTGSGLDHGVVGADAVAVVTREAVAARQTAPRLEQRVRLVER